MKHLDERFSRRNRWHAAFGCAGVLLLAAGCAAGATASSVPASDTAGAVPSVRRGDIVPLVDHHVHLLGPYALPQPDPLPPEVKVPAAIQQLLVARAGLLGNVKDAKDLAPVFTDDAQLLNATINPTAWLRDRFWFMRYLNLWSPTRRRFVPNAFQISGDTGFVTGTVLVEETGVHTMNFLLGIKKGSDGRWRISSDSTTRKTQPNYTKPLTADRLIADLDEAGIKRGVVLSVAYWLGTKGAEGVKRSIPVQGEAAATRAENVWTAQQVARYPDRLVLACGVNPLKDYALAEIEFCSGEGKGKAIKLNFGDSGIDFHNPEHVAKLREFFAAANAAKLAIIVHLEPGVKYGPEEVKIFLDQIVAPAPGLVVQIAHLAGNGPGITSPEALEAFAQARAAGDPRTRNLYFDLAGLVTKDLDEKGAQLMATRIRQLGIEHVLYASDEAPGVGPNAPTAEQWTLVRRKLPLTDAELSALADNVAPYLR